MYLNRFHPGYTLDYFSGMYPEQLNFQGFLILQRCNLKDMDENTVDEMWNLKYINDNGVHFSMKKLGKCT